MKTMIAWPPLKGPGCPMLGQNRQFQWFNNPCYIYPMVPASAASLLKANNFNVIWTDCIAGEKSLDQFYTIVLEEKPDLIVMETKTPVVKQHWQIIKELKETARNVWPLKIVLMGDHVTARPEESMKESQVDFIITGGDYDFLLLNLCQALAGPDLSLKVELLESGIWYRDNHEVKNTGPFKLNHDLNQLPYIDRDLTEWQLYSEKNGNYKKRPGTYVMAGRDCWYHKCTFCSWTTTYPTFRVRRPDNLVDEIGQLIERYQVQEVMDDTGCFPAGAWLREFCQLMIERGYNRKVIIDCNMRFGALSLNDYKLMKKAGFRLILFGLESGNDETLKRINKGVTVREIIESCRNAHRAGLFPHLTVMFGYPWEGEKEINNTVKLAYFLMRKGYAYTLQSTIVIPYPGTPLFDYCLQNDLLATLDWDRYDMREAVMKTPVQTARIHQAVRDLYKVAFNPEFLIHKIFAIRDFDDIRYFIKASQAVFGHLIDFRGER